MKGSLRALQPTTEGECGDMTVIHGDVYSKQRSRRETRPLICQRKTKRGSEAEPLRCLHSTLPSIRKLAKFVIMNKDSSFISLHWSRSLYLLCMISAQECCHYVHSQCTLTWLAQFQCSFRQHHYGTCPSQAITADNRPAVALNAPPR